MAETPDSRAAKLTNMRTILNQMISVNSQIDSLASSTEKQDLCDALSDLGTALGVVIATLDYTHA